MTEQVNLCVEAVCLSCGAKLTPVLYNVSDTRFGIGRTYDICQCADCGLKQTIPTLSINELKTLYETYYNFGAEKGTSYARLRERFLFAPLYRIWLAIDGDFSVHSCKASWR